MRSREQQLGSDMEQQTGANRKRVSRLYIVTALVTYVKAFIAESWTGKAQTAESMPEIS